MKDSVKAGVTTAPFDKMPDGTPISVYTLDNGKGMVMKVINYGGIITQLMVPDRNGKSEDVVLGCNSLEDYVKASSFLGALIGRYGNRIGNGKFKVDGKEYKLAANNGPNNLHGGPNGFDKAVWNIEELTTQNGVAIKLTYLSKDMEEGFPGNLQCEVIYTLTDDNQLKVDYKATTDKSTVVNLTQHTYFNLSAFREENILSHDLTINADKFVPVNKTLIPTGELANVDNTPFDFRKPVKIGLRINQKDQQLEYGNGYDHCWVINGAKANELVQAAVAYDSISGREMTVLTTEPGIQIYSGNFLNGTIKGKNGIAYKQRSGLCLETEHYPDSPNQKKFPPVILKPGETYTTQTVYKFTIR